MSTRLRVGVVGLRVGREHVAAFYELREQFQVTALYDLDPQKAAQLGGEYAVAGLAPSFEAMCEMDNVDVIDICTPSFLHFEQTLHAVRSGKHVICEKPIALSVQQVEQLIQAERQSSRRIMPIFQYRFGHGIQKLKFLVDQGLVGKAYLATIETHWRRRADYYDNPWRGRRETELGGPTVTLASHHHDLLYYLLDPAKSVFARTATRVNPIQTEDCMTATLEMKDGSLAALSMTTGSARPISRLRFCFSNLTAESDVDSHRSVHEPWLFTGDTAELSETILGALKNFTLLPEAFVGQFSRYYEAMMTDTPLPVTLRDAWASIELSNAIYQSAQSNAPVSLQGYPS